MKMAYSMNARIFNNRKKESINVIHIKLKEGKQIIVSGDAECKFKKIK